MKPNAKTNFAITSALVVLLALLIAPGIVSFGMRAATMDHVTSLFPANGSQQFSIQEISFDRNWFSSSAVVLAEVSFTGLDTLSLEMDVEIQHGPLLLSQSGFQFGIAHGVITPNLDTLFPDNEFEGIKAESTLFAGFDQSLTFTATIAPIEQVANGVEVEFSGVQAKLLIAADQSANLDLNLEKLYLQDEQNQDGFKLDRVTVQGFTQNIGDMFAPSQFDIAVQEIDGQSGQPINLKGIEISYILEDQAGSNSLRASQKLAVDSIRGEIAIDSLFWSSSVSEIPRTLIAPYAALLAEIQRLAQDSTPQAITRLNLATQELGLLIINNPLTLESKLNGSVFGGDHTAQFQFDWSGMPDLRNFLALDIFEAIAATSFAAEASFDLAAIEKSPAASLLPSLIQQEQVEIQNGRVLANISLQNRDLIINGKQVPIEQFF